MGRELQTLNHNSRLMEWSKRVESCRGSGLTVTEWCHEQGIPVSTYYHWQRKVFEAVAAKREVCFAEVAVEQPVRTVSHAVATVQYENTRIEVYPGADSETLQAILRAVKSC